MHMKKALRNIFLFAMLISFTAVSAQSRYVDDVFNRSDIKVTSDVIYGINFNEYAPVSIGGPQLLPLFCDVYEPDPSVDTLTDRPVVIYFHTGSFLPKGLVSPMGEKTDRRDTGHRDDQGELCAEPHRLPLTQYMSA